MNLELWSTAQSMKRQEFRDTYSAVTNSGILDCLHIGKRRACRMCCGVLVHVWLSEHCILYLFCNDLVSLSRFSNASIFASNWYFGGPLSLGRLAGRLQWIVVPQDCALIYGFCGLRAVCDINARLLHAITCGQGL